MLCLKKKLHVLNISLKGMGLYVIGEENKEE